MEGQGRVGRQGWKGRKEEETEGENIVGKGKQGKKGAKGGEVKYRKGTGEDERQQGKKIDEKGGTRTWGKEKKEKRGREGQIDRKEGNRGKGNSLRT